MDKELECNDIDDLRIIIEGLNNKLELLEGS